MIAKMWHRKWCNWNSCVKGQSKTSVSVLCPVLHGKILSDTLLQNAWHLDRLRWGRERGRNNFLWNYIKFFFSCNTIYGFNEVCCNLILWACNGICLYIFFFKVAFRRAWFGQLESVVLVCCRYLSIVVVEFSGGVSFAYELYIYVLMSSVEKDNCKGFQTENVIPHLSLLISLLMLIPLYLSYIPVSSLFY